MYEKLSDIYEYKDSINTECTKMSYMGNLVIWQWLHIVNSVQDSVVSNWSSVIVVLAENAED